MGGGGRVVHHGDLNLYPTPTKPIPDSCNGAHEDGLIEKGGYMSEIEMREESRATVLFV
jgi:hypothetical protein